MAKYRDRLFVDAQQWFPQLAIEGVCTSTGSQCCGQPHIHVDSNVLSLDSGDWIVTDRQGVVSVHSAVEFSQIYELVLP